MHFFENINWAHVHLIINHIPVVAIPVTLLFLIWSEALDNRSMKQVSLLFLIVLSFIAVGVFLTGEPAEEIIEKLPGIAETVIEAHEKFGWDW